VLGSIGLIETIEELKLVWEPVRAVAGPRRNQTPSAMELSSIFGNQNYLEIGGRKLEAQVRGRNVVTQQVPKAEEV
jgi:hypothetical protein